MEHSEYRTMYGVQGDEVVEVQACVAADGGWLVKQGCMRQHVSKDKLSTTREAAEQRLLELGPSTTEE